MSTELTPMQELIEHIRLIQSATHTQEQYRAFNIVVGTAMEYLDKETALLSSLKQRIEELEKER